MPIVLKNRIPAEIKNNPKAIVNLILTLKPGVKLREVKVKPSGDIHVTGMEPRDFSVMRQDWPEHEEYGRITPMIPHEKSVDQAVLILGVPLSITNEDIGECLYSLDLHPKRTERFTKKGTQEKSTTVKVTFSSQEQKQKILSGGIRMFFQSFRVVDYVPDPDIIQCFRCQGFGHHHWECQAEKQKCLRCGGDHRVKDCMKERDSPQCANCGGAHTALYRGCQAYKAAARAEREKIANEPSAMGTINNNNNNHNNNNSSNNNNNISIIITRTMRTSLNGR